jgi:hypothetical protein
LCLNQIQWFRGTKELTKRDYTITHTDGVITLEIIDCKPEDSGKYRCVATNKHGSDETSCVVIVEGNTFPIKFIFTHTHAHARIHAHI